MINEEIRDKEVRLIGPDGEQLGIVDNRTAQNMAEEKNLDLVKIAPQVKVSVRFRGREITHSSLGRDLLNRFKEGVGEVGGADKDIKMEGRSMAMIVSPKKA